MEQQSFAFPAFYNYPPYFTLQPVKDTEAKQTQLWEQLILDYCKFYNISVLHVEEDTPLFMNTAINRKLNAATRVTFLQALVSKGRAEWLDNNRGKCLILWRSVDDWSNIVYQWVKDNALVGDVMTVEELRSGPETRGTKLQDMDKQVLYQALKRLEGLGKARLFTGSSAEDEGVKFFA